MKLTFDFKEKDKLSPHTDFSNAIYDTIFNSIIDFYNKNPKLLLIDFFQISNSEK